jgi:zinc D-Ala-D-Ala dipeptidase
MRKLFVLVLLGLFAWVSTATANTLPQGFVYLKDIDPSIIQEIRYATYHNFVGRPIAGYEAEACILTKPAALALSRAQKELRQSGLSLKVYDCYRPQMAVDEFVAWSQKANQQEMKPEFYPRVNKKEFFKLGYVAEQSGHTRGSTLDVTIVALPPQSQAHYMQGEKLISCYAPYAQRFRDNSVDMGTGYDCMDKLAHNDNSPAAIGVVAWHYRMLLKALMEKNGFTAYQPEWWHFTLKNEPYPKTYFNFKVSPRF